MLLKRLIGYGLVVGLGVLLMFQLKHAVIGASQAEGKVCLGLQPEPLNVTAPTFKLKDLDGKEHALAEYKGRALLLHFWFTRCPPCIQELPSLAALHEQMSGKKFQVVTVSVDDKADEAREFLRKYQLTKLPVLYDPSKRVPASYGTTKYPESYLIDRDGVTRYRFVNKRDWSSDLARACVRSVL